MMFSYFIPLASPFDFYVLSGCLRARHSFSFSIPLYKGTLVPGPNNTSLLMIPRETTPEDEAPLRARGEL
jgi:hypothetical protein